MQVQEGKSSGVHLPWTEKYRPQEMKSLISHQNILATLNQFARGQSFPNLIFYGPPGTGKTSTIVAYAKQIYGDSFKRNVLELNASDERGINVVRQQIKSFASSGALTMATDHKIPKLIILDEADNMTSIAQFALRRIIQKYYRNVRFCFISNYISKIIPALISRCTRFKFNLIPFESAKTRIQSICAAERLKINDEGIKAVFHLCDGDMRRVVNLLQSLSLDERDGSTLTSEDVYSFTSHPSPNIVNNILQILMQKDFKSAYEGINDIKISYGISLQTLLKELYVLILSLGMQNSVMAKILSRFSQIEYRLSLGCDQRIQLASLVGVFIQSRILKKD